MSGCSDTERRYILDTGWFVAPCPCDRFTRHLSHKSFRTRSTSTEVTIRINTKKTCSKCGAQRLTAPPVGSSCDRVCVEGRCEPVNRDSCPNLGHRYVLSPGGSSHPLATRYVPCIDSASVGSVPAAVHHIASRGRQQSAWVGGSGERSVPVVQQSRSWHMMGRDTTDSPLYERVTKGSCPNRLNDSPPCSPLSVLSGHVTPSQTFHLLSDTASRPESPRCHQTRGSPTTPPLMTSPPVLNARRQCLFASSSSGDLHCGGCTGRTSPIYWELERPRSQYSGTAAVAAVKSGRTLVSGLIGAGDNMRKSYSDSGHSSPVLKSLSSSPEVAARHSKQSSTECGCVSHQKCSVSHQKPGEREPEHARSMSSPLDVFSAIWRPGRRSHITDQVGGGQKKHRAVTPNVDKQHRCQTPPRVLSPTNEVVTCEVIADI
ncbi:hypothetical protein LSAT2_011435 [Lamellibrachia satsuma]|nr:hypothetical protein LSAT2_011435 [Lamellibrachia satsuma]